MPFGLLYSWGGVGLYNRNRTRAPWVAFFLQGRVVIRGISWILRYLIPTYPPKFRLPTGVDS